MRPAGKAAAGSLVRMVAVGLLASALGGCSTIGTYPGEWPAIEDGARIGDCPDIAGTYRNEGSRHPREVPARTLTGLLGLTDGERVAISQSAESITLTVWAGDRTVGVQAFAIARTRRGWDPNRRQAYTCPVDGQTRNPVVAFTRGADQPVRPDGAARGSGSSVSGSGAFGMVDSHSSGLSRAADGSLVVVLESSGFVLLGPITVGGAERSWYRFESLRATPP